MASITVTQNCYWGGPEYNWAGLVYGDNVTVNSGAVLTVDPAQYTPTGLDVGVRIISTSGFGEVVFDNNGATALRHYGPYQQTLQIETGSKITVRSHLFTIYTGNGNASQTTTGWTTAGFVAADIPAVLLVETGNNTDVWEEWVNLDTTALSSIGVGELGKWFNYNTSTGVITFGDGGAGTAGHGGKVVPSNARVRAYSTLWGTKNSGGTIIHTATAGDNYELDVSLGGRVDVSGLYCSGMYFWVASPSQVSIDGIGSTQPVYIQNISGSTIRNISVCPSSIGSETVYRFAILNIAPNVTLSGIVAAGTNQNAVIYLAQMSNSTMSDITGVNLARNATGDVALRVANCSNCEMSDLKVIGSRYQFDSCSNLEIDGIGVSNSVNSDVYGSLYEAEVSNNQDTSTGIKIKNLYKIADGALSVGMTRHVLYMPRIQESAFPTNAQAFCEPTKAGLKVIDCDIGSPTAHLITWNNTYSDVLLQNVRTTTINMPLYRSGYLSSNTIFKAVDASTIPQPSGWAVNTHFYEMRTATNSGLIGIIFSDYSSGYQYISVSGSVVFSGNGSMYMPVSQGDSIVFTWPHRIIGVTGLLGALTLGGANTQYFTVEYSIDNGNTWSVVNETNMQAETVSPSSGFPLKIRITHTRVSAADYLNLLNFTTAVDYVNYKYPIDVADVTLQNIQQNSRWMLYNVTDSTVIASGEQSGTSDITVANVPSTGTNKTLKLTVRKSSSAPYYKPFETNAIFTGNNLSIYVSQELDTVAGG